MARRRNPKRKAPPWRFVKGAPAGYRKLKNRLTGKTRLIKVGRYRATVDRLARRKPGRMQRRRKAFRTLKSPLKNPAGKKKTSHRISSSYVSLVKKLAAHVLALPQGNWPETNNAEDQLQEVIEGRMSRKQALLLAIREGARLHPSRNLKTDFAAELASLPEASLKNYFGVKRKTENPVRIRRTARGRFQVKSGKRLTATGTTRLRAMRQATLVRSVKRGWRPTGKPSIGARKKVAQLKGNNMLAFRKKRKWTVIRGSMKAGKFRVIKKGLSDGALKTWARSEKHQLRQM